MSLKISIITPSFNQGNFLEETIQSVLNQQYKNLEYIVMDGGSTDNSVDIIKKYEDRITLWVSEKDRGQSHAINKGFQKASGKIIAWLNSDDLYLPNTLKKVNEIFRQNPEVDLIYGDVFNLYPDGKEKLYKVNPFEPEDFLSRVSIHQPAVFWRKKILDKTGLLDENLHFTMDYDLWARVFFSFKTLKVNLPLARFRVHEQSKTSVNPPEMYLESRIVLSRFFNSIPEKKYKSELRNLNLYNNPGDQKYDLKIKLNTKLKKRIFNNHIFNCALQEYTFGDPKKANLLFRKSLFKKGVIHPMIYLVKNSIK